MSAKLNDEMIRELCVITTKDESGRHFTEWSQHYHDLEELGLVEVTRDKFPDGTPYDEQYWSIVVTPEGQDVVDANPELHPE